MVSLLVLPRMANEKNRSPHSGSGTNWLFGLEKLTTPSFDYLGIRLRDKLRAYLTKKARERAVLRKFEKGFLYRHIDLLSYGADQYSAILETIADHMMEQHFEI